MTKFCAAVQELASSAAISQLLQTEGIRGQRKSPCNCPIARFLTKRTGSPCYAQWGRCGLIPVGNADWNFTPFNVAIFIKNFDDGLHPELDEALATS